MYYDFYFEKKPNRELGIESDQIYALVHYTYKGVSIYHALLTEEQYQSVIKVFGTCNIKEKLTRKTLKPSGLYEDTPYHCFGDSVTDFTEKKQYFPTEKNKSLEEAVKDVI